MTTEADILAVITGLASLHDKENIDLFHLLNANGSLSKIADDIADLKVNAFRLGLPYKTEKLLSGAILSVTAQKKQSGEWPSPQQDKLEFLFLSADFVKINFQRYIEEIEGSACCADKSRTIVARLARYFATGEEIVFDYSGEYTYHLPQQIFRHHSEIIDFFEGLRSFYYGNPDPYFEASKGLVEKVKVVKQRECARLEYVERCLVATAAVMRIDRNQLVQKINANSGCVQIIHEGFEDMKPPGEIMWVLVEKLDIHSKSSMSS